MDGLIGSGNPDRATPGRTAAFGLCEERAEYLRWALSGLSCVLVTKRASDLDSDSKFNHVRVRGFVLAGAPLK